MDDAATAVKPGRKERERAERRAAMLMAARQVFAEKGYAGARLDEIAARAEFGKGTLYNYFPEGKEELLLAVIEGVYDELCTLVEWSFPDDDPLPVRDRFERFLERSFDHFAANRTLFAILMKEAHRLALSENSDRVRFFLQQRQRIVRSLCRPIQAAIDDGDMRPLPADTVAHMLLGNIQGCQMMLALEECGAVDGRRSTADWSSSQAARFLTVLLFDGLLATPAQDNA